MYLGSVTTALTSLFLSGSFRRITDRISPYRTIAIFALLFGINEAVFSFVAPGRVGLYIVFAITYAVIGVGFLMGYNSLLYLNLPKGCNTDVFATFWHLVANLGSLGGSAFGTWVLSKFANQTLPLFSLELYGSQLLCGIKSILCVVFFLLVWKFTPYLQKSRAEQS